MNRREFLAAGAATGAALVAGTSTPAWGRRVDAGPIHRRLRLSPPLGMFRHLAGDAAADQARFVADHGFAGLTDVALMSRSCDELRTFGEALARHELEPGPFLASAEFRWPTFASPSRGDCESVVSDIHRAVDVARSVGGRSLIVVPGRRDSDAPRAPQLRQAAERLRRCADLAGLADATLLVEPVASPHARRRLLVETLDEAAELCEVVDHPRCRALCDLYDVAMERGTIRSTDEILAAMARCRRHVGFVQLGDAPGRKEPGTGRLDFAAIFDFLVRQLPALPLVLAHGASHAGPEGEGRILAAYLNGFASGSAPKSA